MSFVCLWTPRWRTDAASAAELAPALLACVPRVTTDARGRIWADARGMDVASVVEGIADVLSKRGVADVRIGAAMTAVAAEIAAEFGMRNSEVVFVEPGTDAEFIAPFAVDVLGVSSQLLTLLEGTGIATCGDLARLDQEAVEVRFGIEGVRLWHLARADDRRLIFTEVSRELPHASLDWTDYTLTDPERLVFIINALAERVTTSLEERGESAREIAAGGDASAFEQRK